MDWGISPCDLLPPSQAGSTVPCSWRLSAFLLVDGWLPGSTVLGVNGDVIETLKYGKTPERKELEKNEDVEKKTHAGLGNVINCQVSLVPFIYYAWGGEC